MESRAGCPQDGEFAVHAEQIFLLQARPETVWSNKPRPSAPTSPNALAHVLARLPVMVRQRAAADISGDPPSINRPPASLQTGRTMAVPPGHFDTEMKGIAMSPKSFPSPFEVETPPGAEGWESMYNWYHLFGDERRGVR